MTAPLAIAKYATPPTPGRRHYGPAVTAVARSLALPPMPWQSHLYRVGTELLPTGEWAYNRLVVSVPRQSGKTAGRGPIMLHRCIIRPMARCWLTAQTRQDARDILVDDVGPRFHRSPLRGLAKLRKSQGSEGIYFHTGSFWRVFAPGDDDLHGKANDAVDVDEAWTFTAAQGAALQQAIGPTFSTTDGQLTIFSTRGTARSVWLDGWIDTGRAAVLSGARDGVCFLEISLPDHLVDEVRAGLHAEKLSPQWEAAIATVIHHHPAYGYTLKPRALRADALGEGDGAMSPDDWLRAYGNIPTRTAASLIPPASWAATKLPEVPRPNGPLALAVEVGIRGADAAIIAAWWLGDDVVVDVVDSRPGLAWVPDRIADLTGDWKPSVIGHAGAGPVVELADRLAIAGHEVTALTASEFAAACSGLLTAVDEATMFHTGHPDLDAAVANVATRPLGDGGIAFARLASSGSISPLVGAAVARWLLMHLPPPTATPGFHTKGDTT